MDQLELLKKVLRLPQHWQVVDVASDEETRQLTVSLHFVRTRRRLLGGETHACARCGQSLAPTPASRYLQLRHLPLADWQVNLRLPDTTSGCADRACPASAELAEPGTRVTHALASRIVALHTGGASLATTAALLDVDVSDVTVVLAARGMPVDALTGEITLGDSGKPPWDTLARASVDALAPAQSVAEPAPDASSPPVVDGTAAQARDHDAAPLAPIAAPLTQVQPPREEDAARAEAPALPAEHPGVDAADDAPIPLAPTEPESHPVPTRTLLEEDEAQAQAALDEAIEGETDALAFDSIDEHTQSSATLLDDVNGSEAAEDGAGQDAATTDQAVANKTAAALPEQETLEQVPASEPAATADGDAASAGEDPSPGEVTGEAVEAEPAVAAESPAEEGPADEDTFEEGAPSGVHASPAPEQAVEGTTAARGEPVAAAPAAESTPAEPVAEEPAAEPAPAEPETAQTTAAPAAPEPVAKEAAEPAAVPVLTVRAEAPELPSVEHAVWGSLLRAEFNLQTEALALQMLLARLRQFVRTSDDPSAVSAAARVLHKHLGQSAKRYAAERAQLLAVMNGAVPASDGASDDSASAPRSHEATVVVDDEMAASTIPTLQAQIPSPPPKLSVPPVEDPVWMQLVNGQRPLVTTSVALKMMLEQIKRSAQSDPSDATRLAGVRLLHTFFSKTSRQLTGELRQLHEGATNEQDAPANTAAPPPESASEATPVEPVPVVQPRIPPETSPSWQALLDGRVVPSQEDPGLSMLMEKVRRVTSQGETSGEVMAAAARVLRRYLARYARRHVDLLAELNSLDLSTTTQQRTSRLSRTWRGGNRRGTQVAASADVPPVDDPVWRRLMDGELLLETDAFALRMMLERIRRSVRRDPSEGNRQAAALQLRDYFVKHERVHRAELQRIRAA